MRTIAAFFAVWVICGGTLASSPLYVDSIINTENWNVYQDLVVSEWSVINAENVNIANTVYFHNMGSIEGDFFICAGCVLQLRNSGIISGKIHVGESAELTQIVKTYSDMTKLDVEDGAKFSILVQNADGLRFSDIMSIAESADLLILDNSIIVFDNSSDTMQISGAQLEIELVGNIVINVKDIGKLDESLVLSNVVGDGTVSINTSGLGPLYSASAIKRDGGIYLNIQRETDYKKILGSSMGGFVNRMASLHDPTITAMNSAKTMQELQDIMKRSVSLNPINLMKPVKAFNRFATGAARLLRKSDGASFGASYALSKDSDLYWASASAGALIGDWSLSATGYFGRLENSGDMNEFSGALYGGNIRWIFSGKTLWIDSVAGFTMSKFETGMLFDGFGAARNPDGFSFYGVSDIGVKFDAGDDFYISPFAGAWLEYEKVLNFSEFGLSAHAGGIAGFSSKYAGIKNNYQLFMSVGTGGIKSIGANADFWSISDSAGCGFSYEMMMDNVGISHKLSANVRFIF
ncbi:MAG: autotransporter outer membrane beta-barrel domain-containing protein [Rickettsiales bacterium]|jgi:hypothetical protein|nr:autotransporter outer membrane beta-barrel domain-containing protein [Rickettsiales bacterium]